VMTPMDGGRAPAAALAATDPDPVFTLEWLRDGRPIWLDVTRWDHDVVEKDYGTSISARVTRYEVGAATVSTLSQPIPVVAEGPTVEITRLGAKTLKAGAKPRFAISAAWPDGSPVRGGRLEVHFEALTTARESVCTSLPITNSEIPIRKELASDKSPFTVDLPASGDGTVVVTLPVKVARGYANVRAHYLPPDGAAMPSSSLGLTVPVKPNGELTKGKCLVKLVERTR